MASYDSYQALCISKINSIELLWWHFKSILESVHRRLVTKEKLENPWQIIIKVNVHQKTFIQFYRFWDKNSSHSRQKRKIEEL